VRRGEREGCGITLPILLASFHVGVIMWAGCVVLDIGAALLHSGVGWVFWRWRLLVRWWSSDLVFIILFNTLHLRGVACLGMCRDDRECDVLGVCNSCSCLDAAYMLLRLSSIVLVFPCHRKHFMPAH
jgi:hypothetical protein